LAVARAREAVARAREAEAEWAPELVLAQVQAPLRIRLLVHTQAPLHTQALALPLVWDREAVCVRVVWVEVWALVGEVLALAGQVWAPVAEVLVLEYLVAVVLASVWVGVAVLALASRPRVAVWAVLKLY
jgi:hypothetical protein